MDSKMSVVITFRNWSRGLTWFD